MENKVVCPCCNGYIYFRKCAFCNSEVELDFSAENKDFVKVSIKCKFCGATNFRTGKGAMLKLAEAWNRMEGNNGTI
jgi:hypothetical protein